MATRSSLATGIGRVLIAVYGILALAATGRSVVQIIEKFSFAPFAYTLSAVAAVVYIVATLALALRRDRLAWVTIGFELVGVLVVGALTLLAPAVLGLGDVELLDRAFGREGTVWALFGLGYLCVPLVLPVIGLLYLASTRRAAVASAG